MRNGTAITISASLHPAGDLFGEVRACVAIDFTNANGCPADELLRIHVHEEGDPAERTKLMEALREVFLPLVEAAREAVGVGHDLQDARPVLAPPADDDGGIEGPPAGHGALPIANGPASVAVPAGGVQPGKGPADEGALASMSEACKAAGSPRQGGR